MNKKDLIRRVNEELRRNGQKKPIATERHSFYVTDDEGNSAEFIIREKSRDVIYTAADVEKFVDACISVILKALENGEEINIHGFASVKLITKGARKMHSVRTGEIIELDEFCVPVFSAGADIKKAARVFDRTIRRSYANTEGGDE